MTTCRGCGALVQPEWDRCKICGQGDDDSPETDAAPTRSKRRSRRPKRGAEASIDLTHARDERDPAPAPRQSAAARPRLQPTRASAGSEAPIWLVGAGLVAVILGCLYIIITDDGDTPPAQDGIPAAESDPDAGDPIWTELEGEWDTYSSPDGMRVDLPAEPLETTEPVTVPSLGQVDMFRATVLNGGVTLAASWAPIPEGVQDRPDLVIEGAVQSVAESVGGEVAATKRVTVDGQPALRARIVSPEAEWRVTAIADSTNFYLLEVDAGEDGTLYLQRLIDTFDA